METFEDKRETFVLTEISNQLRALKQKHPEFVKRMMNGPDKRYAALHSTTFSDTFEREKESRDTSASTLLAREVWAALDDYDRGELYKSVRNFAKAAAVMITMMYWIYNDIHRNELHGKGATES